MPIQDSDFNQNRRPAHRDPTARILRTIHRDQPESPHVRPGWIATGRDVRSGTPAAAIAADADGEDLVARLLAARVEFAARRDGTRGKSWISCT
jgi:hypothetical protein